MSTEAPWKTILVFGPPPHIDEEIKLGKNKRPRAEEALSKSLQLKWEGFNYLVRDKKIQHNYNVDEASDSSDGIILNYSLKENETSLNRSSDMSEEHFQFTESTENSEISLNLQSCSFNSDERASLNSEFDFVMKNSQDIFNLSSNLVEPEKSLNKDNVKDDNCTSYVDMLQGGAARHFRHYCKGIRRDNISAVGQLEVEPLCKIRTGKFNILAFVLQVNVERSVRLRNGSYAQFAALYVADINSDYVKLTLWHDSKHWIKNIDVGCAIVVTDVVQHTWKSQISLATSFSSQIFDCCHAKKNPPESWSGIIRKEILHEFFLHMERKYPSISMDVGLFSKVRVAENIESFDNIVPGSIVNIVAMVSSICTHNMKENDWPQCPQTTVWLKDNFGRKKRLLVWQNEPSMLSILRKNHGNWLKFENLAVQTVSNGVGLELNSLSDTVVTCLRVSQLSNKYSSVEKKRYKGFSEKITGYISYLEFLDKKGNNIKFTQNLLDLASNDTASDTLSLLEDLMYVACSYCFSELEVVRNSEREECKRCIKMSWRYNFKQVDVLRPFKLWIICGNLDPLSIAVFPNDFDKLKDKVPLKDILQLCKSSKVVPMTVLNLKECISRIFNSKVYAFFVSREETDSSDTFTTEEVCLLKDVEEQKPQKYFF